MLLALFVSLALHAAVQPKPGVVRGRVTAADTGAPLKRAEVTLRSGSNTYTAATDSEGRYEIANLGPGNYAPSCEKSGYISTTQQSGKANGTQVRVAEGQEAADINFSLQRAGVISGKVTDEDGEPIVNATVQATVRIYRQGHTQLAGLVTVKTDDLGAYRLHDLRAGRYYVQADKRPQTGQPGLHFAPSLYPGVTSLSDAQSVQVTGGVDAPGINFQLKDSAVYTVSGRVMDIRTGQPVSNSVIAVRLSGMISTGATNAVIGANGVFRIPDLTPGRYSLQFSTQGPSGRIGGSKTVEVNGDVSDVTLTIGPGATIKGRLQAEGGDLPAQVQVQLIGASSEGTSDNAIAGGRTQSDGTFELANVEPGDYDLRVQQATAGPGAALTAFFVRDINVGRQNIGDGYVNVPDGSTSVELSAMLDFHSGTITGQLTDAADPDNKPLTNAEIVVVSTDPKKRVVERYYCHVRSDATGHFQATGLAPGDYYLVPWDGQDPFALMDPDLFAQVEKLAVSVSVSASGTTMQDLKMTPGLRTIAQAASQ
jgi:uncharacterized surface anchored protein